MNGTANFDDRTHHVLYGTIHAFIIYFNSGCTLFNALSYRYYADFFNQNQQLRLILAMFNKRTNSFNYSSKHRGNPSMFPINPVIKLAVISHNFSKHRQMFSALPFDPGRI